MTVVLNRTFNTIGIFTLRKDIPHKSNAFKFIACN